MSSLDGARIAGRCPGRQQFRSRQEFRRCVGGIVETAAALRAVPVLASDWGRANGTHAHGRAHLSHVSTKKPASIGVIMITSEKSLAASKQGLPRIVLGSAKSSRLPLPL